jgi:hypothetical protein
MENEDANDALDHLRPPDSNRWLCWYLRPWTSHMGILVLYDRLCKGTFRISIHPSDGLIVFQFLDARQHSLLHSSVETLPGGAFTAPSSMMSALIVVRTLHFQNSHGLDGRLWSWGSAWIRFLRLMAITEFYTDCK